MLDRCKIEFGSGAYGVVGKPAAAGFESVEHIFANGFSGFGIVCVERVDFAQDSVGGEESDIDGEADILHPVGHSLRFLVDEKHSVIVGDSVAKHQSFGLFASGDGELDRNRLMADLQLGRDGRACFLYF